MNRFVKLNSGLRNNRAHVQRVTYSLSLKQMVCFVIIARAEYLIMSVLRDNVQWPETKCRIKIKIGQVWVWFTHWWFTTKISHYGWFVDINLDLFQMRLLRWHQALNLFAMMFIFSDYSLSSCPPTVNAVYSANMWFSGENSGKTI